MKEDVDELSILFEQGKNASGQFDQLFEGSTDTTTQSFEDT